MNVLLTYMAAMLTVAALCQIVLLFFYGNIFFGKENKHDNAATTYQKTIEDLDRMIQRKCAIAYRRALEPYVNKALKNRPLINDKIVNEISITITKDILEEMSDDYKNKLATIYKEEMINDIILEQVYNTVTEMAMTINKTSIKKMNFTRRIGNITKNDIDLQ